MPGKMFARTHTQGEACQTIGDGFGGLYYGSCDPQEAFCCIPSELMGCEPFPVLNQEGTCQKASAEGESCGTEPLQLCKSGLECDYATNVCVALNTTPLALGEQCYDSNNYSILGECVDSWCDLFNSGACEAKLEDGASCLSYESCESEFCDEGTCAPNTICVE